MLNPSNSVEALTGIHHIIRQNDEIMSDTKAILTSLEALHAQVNSLKRTVFQLHENTVPRLFIVRPEDGKLDLSIDVLFTKQYGLSFICEHHERLNDGTMKSYAHLSNHEGYHIRKPREVRLST